MRSDPNQLSGPGRAAPTMPLGFLRLNERSQRPNSHINFIQPLPNRGSDTAIAQCFLERIAAQCYPIMKEHGLAIMTLAEHEPNAEFLGRNFNAGEVIELVLKDRRGRWLGFKFVQMVRKRHIALLGVAPPLTTDARARRS